MVLQTPEQRQFLAALRQLDQRLGRQRRNRLMVRAVWIALLVACFGLIIQGWLDWPIQTPLIWQIAGVALALGVTYALLPSPGSQVLAQGFDRTFQLDEELATALELSVAARRDGLSPLVLERARRHLALVEREVTLRAAEPMRVELQTLAMAFVLAGGVLLLGSLTTVLPTVPAASLPEPGQPAAAQPPELAGAEPSPDPAQAPEQPGGEQQIGNQPSADPQLSPQDQAAASAIADALRDNGATRAAADSLDRGNPAQAAQELRELADQAAGLSRESRQDLADELDQAAEELEANQPELADRLRSNADKLRSNADQAAAQAFEDLAEDLERLGSPDDSAGQQPGDPNPTGEQGQSGAGQGQAGEQGQSSQQAEQPGAGPGAGSGAGTGSRQAPPPAAEAPNNPVPLPEAPTTDGPTTPGRGNSETVITKPPSISNPGPNSGGSGGSVPGDLSDPAAIPADLRDAVQDYFDGQSR